MGIPIGWLIGFRGIQGDLPELGAVVDWMLRLVRHPKNGGRAGVESAQGAV